MPNRNECQMKYLSTICDTFERNSLHQSKTFFLISEYLNAYSANKLG